MGEGRGGGGEGWEGVNQEEDKGEVRGSGKRREKGGGMQESLSQCTYSKGMMKRQVVRED